MPENRYRSQVLDHERPFCRGEYVRQYRRKETKSVEDVAEVFHENTKLNPVVSERLSKNSTSIAGALASIEKQIDPDYLDREKVELPDPPRLTADVGTVIEERRSAMSFADRPFSVDQLSQCLYYGAGQPIDGIPSRTYPSPGGLYPSQLFPVLIDVSEVDPGLYYYDNSGHFLRAMDRFENVDGLRERIRDCIYVEGVVPDIDDIPVLFLVTADFWRAKFKYGPRGYRYVLQESGHLAQNVLLTLTAMGAAGRPMAAYRDRAVNEFVGLDGVNEAVTYTIAAGHAESHPQ